MALHPGHIQYSPWFVAYVVLCFSINFWKVQKALVFPFCRQCIVRYLVSCRCLQKNSIKTTTTKKDIQTKRQKISKSKRPLQLSTKERKNTFRVGSCTETRVQSKNSTAYVKVIYSRFWFLNGKYRKNI